VETDQVAIAEYGALRAEILTHVAVQQGILTITVGLAGTLVGLAIDKSLPELILVLPPATLLLGSAYFEAGRRIFVLAAYIVQVLDRRVPGIAGWEKSRFRSELGGFAPGVLHAVVFAVGPLGGLIYVATEKDVSGAGWSAIASAAALALFLLTLGMAHHARPKRERNYPQAS
jgi:hypothetical protein